MVMGYRFSLGLGVALAAGSALAGPSFFDPTLDLAGYSLTAPYRSDARITITAAPCAACGSPGSALQVSVGLPYTGNGTGAIGFINNGWSYDPSIEGAIASIDASVDKLLTFFASDTGGYPGPFGNTFRPLIQQGGNYYMATIAGPNLAVQGTIGYDTISQGALVASDFALFDFASGSFGVGNPNFAGGAMSFGIGQISTVGATFTFTDTLITAQYDNLRVVLNTVPEPATPMLLALALAGLGFGRRRGAGGRPGDRQARPA